MDDQTNALAVALFSEILSTDHLARSRLKDHLPKGMEISHFSVLNHLAGIRNERTPAQLAQTFHVTRGAMTNTLSKLEWAGYVNIRPDWDDARRKWVSVSPAGLRARDLGLESITPMIMSLVQDMGEDKVRSVLPILREIRKRLEAQD